MPSRAQPEKPLATAKDSTFAGVVMDLFREHFGCKYRSQIARVINRSPGRVTHILQKPEKQTSETILRMARVFKDRRIHKKIYDAWYRETLGLVDLDPVVITDQEALDEYRTFLQMEDFFSAKHTVEGAFEGPHSPEFKVPLVEACFDSNQILMIPVEAMKYANIMRELALSRGDDILLAKSFCMKAGALRCLTETDLPPLNQLYSKALKLARQAELDTQKQFAHSSAASLRRDVHFAWLDTLLERRQLSDPKTQDVLRDQLPLVSELIKEDSSDLERARMLLLRARIFIVIGRLDDADVVLRESRSLGKDLIQGHIHMCDLARIKLVVAKGEMREALARCERLRYTLVVRHNRFRLRLVEQELTFLLHELNKTSTS